MCPQSRYLYSEPSYDNLSVNIINFNIFVELLIDILIESDSLLINFYLFYMLDFHKIFNQILILYILLIDIFA